MCNPSTFSQIFKGQSSEQNLFLCKRIAYTDGPKFLEFMPSLKRFALPRYISFFHLHGTISRNAINSFQKDTR